MSALVPVVSLRELSEAPLELPEKLPGELVQTLLELMWASLADETWRAYEGTWRSFQRWCAELRLPALPIDPVVVALYMAAHYLTHKPQTLERHLAALQKAHHANGGSGSLYAHPLIRAVLAGAKRLRGTRPEQKSALMLSALRELVALTDQAPSEQTRVRDAALFVIMWAAALRRSTASWIHVEHITFQGDNAFIFVPREKNDRFGRGRTIPLGATDAGPTDPVRRLRELIAVLPATGPLFRSMKSNGTFRDGALSDRGIDSVFRDYLKQMANVTADYGTHSFRSGFVTESKLAGIADALVMIITGQRSTETVLGYVRPETSIVFELTKRLGM